MLSIALSRQAVTIYELHGGNNEPDMIKLPARIIGSDRESSQIRRCGESRRCQDYGLPRQKIHLRLPSTPIPDLQPRLRLRRGLVSTVSLVSGAEETIGHNGLNNPGDQAGPEGLGPERGTEDHRVDQSRDRHSKGTSRSTNAYSGQTKRVRLECLQGTRKA